MLAPIPTAPHISPARKGRFFLFVRARVRLLRIYSGGLLFAMNIDIVTQKRLTTNYYCNTVMPWQTYPINATTRLHVKRLSRLTLAFSKKLENFKAAVALHFAYYNLVRRHGTLRCTPAMAAGVEKGFWTVGQLVEATTWVISKSCRM